MSEERFRRAFVILLVIAISAAFVAMIRWFLLTILIAAIFAAVARPLYLQVERAFRGYSGLAAGFTILVLLVLVITPLSLLASAVASEALRVADNVRPWIDARIAQPSLLDDAIRRLPYFEYLEPHRAEIMKRGAEVVGAIGTFLANSVSAATRGTVLFFFQFFLMLYTMFFFLKDGPRMLQATMQYLPLAQEDKEQMLDKFTSVTRATLKGTLLIGVTQGGLAGLAFWVAGIDGVIFWTTLMIVLSIVPGIGAALVWVPAVILLIAQGAIAQGIGLALFCGLVVGTVDNVMRPWLVGRDTKMHDLLILFSTLGGLFVFGATGFIVGPILAALFITVWEMFGVTFRDALPGRRTVTSSES
ncbi:MAG TPA: AI-2E family transporter [Vicinamibacterales bacterium]|nr:AI-2E family transporter [Vicinamibacterales bacterium]